jgi:hypothetical protein
MKRFWDKVDKQENGCWMWTASTVKDGYGYYKLSNGKSGRAHRISWELANGDIPKKMCVLHKCDTPRCVNPDHLFLGTDADNVKDMMQKGRGKWGIPLSGENHYNFKLTDQQVLEIKALGPYKKQYEIAAIYSVRQSCISKILNNKQRKGYGILSPELDGKE